MSQAKFEQFRLLVEKHKLIQDKIRQLEPGAKFSKVSYTSNPLIYFDWLKKKVAQDEARFQSAFEETSRKKREELERGEEERARKKQKFDQDSQPAMPFSNDPKRFQYGSDPDWTQTAYGAIGAIGMQAAALVAGSLAMKFGGPQAGLATYSGLSALSRGIMGSQLVGHDLNKGAIAVQQVAEAVAGKNTTPIAFAKRVVRQLASTSADNKTPVVVVDVFAGGDMPIDHVQQAQRGYQNAMQHQMQPYAVPVPLPGVPLPGV